MSPSLNPSALPKEYQCGKLQYTFNFMQAFKDLQRKPFHQWEGAWAGRRLEDGAFSFLHPGVALHQLWIQERIFRNSIFYPFKKSGREAEEVFPGLLVHETCASDCFKMGLLAGAKHPYRSCFRPNQSLGSQTQKSLFQWCSNFLGWDPLFRPTKLMPLTWK